MKFCNLIVNDDLIVSSVNPPAFVFKHKTAVTMVKKNG